jgi:hypothetical protein
MDQNRASQPPSFYYNGNEEPQMDKPSGNNKMILYIVIGVIALFTLAAFVMSIIGLTSAPEKWGWKGGINNQFATLSDPDSNGIVTVTYSSDVVKELYNVLYVSNIYNKTVTSAILDISKQSIPQSYMGNYNKVLRIVNNGIYSKSTDTTGVPLTIKGIMENNPYISGSTKATSVVLNVGEYVEISSSKNTNGGTTYTSYPNFMGVGYNGTSTGSRLK